MLKSVGIIAILLGVTSCVVAMLVVLTATGAWHLPAGWFSGRGTSARAGQLIASAIEQVLLQWQLLLVAICAFQLLHGSALGVAGMRTLRLDPAGAALLRFVAKLGIMLDLLKLGPLTLVLVECWRAIREFFPGRFPQLLGVEPVPELSAAQATWLSVCMVAVIAGFITATLLKIGYYGATIRYFNRPQTARLFTFDSPN